MLALILGGVAFLFGVTLGWIPFVGFLAIALALVALVLGILGLLATNKGKGLAIAGTIVSGVALLTSAVITVIMLFLFSQLQSYGLPPDDVGDGSSGPSIVEPDGREADAGVGSIDRPAAIGDTMTFTDAYGDDEWVVVVGQPTLDATAAVTAAHEINNPPAAGNQYVVVPLDYTYVGFTSDMPHMGALPAFVGTDGVFYSLSYVLYPDDVYGLPELTSGGRAHANAVFEVPSSAVDGGVLRLRSVFGGTCYVALAG